MFHMCSQTSPNSPDASAAPLGTTVLAGNHHALSSHVNPLMSTATSIFSHHKWCSGTQEISKQHGFLLQCFSKEPVHKLLVMKNKEVLPECKWTSLLLHQEHVTIIKRKMSAKLNSVLIDMVDLGYDSSSWSHHRPIYKLAPVHGLHFAHRCSIVQGGRTMPLPPVIFNILQGIR